MAMSSKCLRQGFTLLEVSIVLVIIGVIAAGILVGRDLIHVATLRSVVKESTAIKLAINTFREKYQGYPGDFKDATAYWTNTVDGNGDGIISVRSDDANYDMFDGDPGPEYLRAIQQLALSGLIGGTYTGMPVNETTNFYVPGENIIRSDCCGKAGYVIWDNGRSDPAYIADGIRHRTTKFLVLGGIHEPSDTWAFSRGVFTPADAQFIDQKTDDGVAFSGKTFGLTGTGPSSSWFYLAPYCSSVLGGMGPADYQNLTSQVPACIMLFTL